MITASTTITIKITIVGHGEGAGEEAGCGETVVFGEGVGVAGVLAFVCVGVAGIPPVVGDVVFEAPIA
jgi:hypothetical protein